MEKKLELVSEYEEEARNQVEELKDGLKEVGKMIGIELKEEGRVEEWVKEARRKLAEVKIEIWYWLILYEINDNMNSNM